MEIALAYQHLIEQYNLTQERLSERVGKNRTTVTNYLRLLKLPATIQMALKNREIDMGHARALLSLDDPTQQIKAFEEIQRTGMSVRKVEEMVKELALGGTAKTSAKKAKEKKARIASEFNELKKALASLFKTKVQLICSEKGKGKITIPFANEKELERIIDLFDKLKH